MKPRHLKIIAPVLPAIVALLFVVGAMAHEAHNTKPPANNVNSAPANANSAVSAEGVLSPTAPGALPNDPAAEFPTYHPLIVHFPIVLIILAAVLQVLSHALFRRELGWLVLALSLLGAVSAWLSSNVFHPHTTGLSENAGRLLLEHEQYAAIALWLAVGGLVVKAVSTFLLKRKWWSEAVVTVLLAGSAIAVAVTGHHGAELVHKEGVGPRGQFLETHSH